MNTAQLFFRARNANNDEEVLDKVQGYLGALLHNGQIVGDCTPMAKISGGYLVTASVPETDALADRFANKWVRKRLRELVAVGVDRPKVTHLGMASGSLTACLFITTCRSTSGAASSTSNAGVVTCCPTLRLTSV